MLPAPPGCRSAFGGFVTTWRWCSIATTRRRWRRTCIAAFWQHISASTALASRRGMPGDASSAATCRHWCGASGGSCWLPARCSFFPMLSLLLLTQVWPDAAFLLLSPETVGEIEEMYSPTAPHLGRSRAASSEWAMWGFYIANNVRIDFQAFAGGVAFGLGTVFYLVYNGLHIGAIAGHLTQIGYVYTFWGFVAGHSAFELTGAVLAGAAGLKLGMALVAPGRQTRLAALRQHARVAVKLLYGAAALTLLAAFIEAFWSPRPGVPFAFKVTVGGALWLLTWAYLLLAGRARAA